MLQLKFRFKVQNRIHLIIAPNILSSSDNMQGVFRFSMFKKTVNQDH